MASREQILSAIKQNKPAEVPLPSANNFISDDVNRVSKFIEVLTGIGGYCQTVNDLQPVKALLAEHQNQNLVAVNAIEELDVTNIGSFAALEAAQIENVHSVFLKGHLAVSENGAVWLTESSMVNRVLPFITQHLIVVIDEASIVANMHQAYDKITINEEGYGVFIAGPSKTADIEQSLVIGAHGPLSM